MRASPCSSGVAAGRGSPTAAAVRPTNAPAMKGPAFSKAFWREGHHHNRRRRHGVTSSSSSSLLLRHPRQLTSSSSISLAARAAASSSAAEDAAASSSSISLVARAADSSSAAEDAAASSSSSSSPAPSESFDWAANWYPVGSVLSTLDPSKPNKVTLLGKSLVVWLDGSESGGESEGREGAQTPAWRAAVDECPHRLAAMSDGRLEGGVLSCRYHGWEFGGERGLCTRCPQASDARAEATVLASPRARLRSFPCRVAQNLLFVWAQEEREGGFDNASKVPLPLVEDLDPAARAAAAEENNGGGGNAVVFGAGGDWGFQRPPVDWLLMAENSMDPNHAPFLHETVMGPNTRQSAAPMEMRLSAERPVTLSGFEVEHGGYTKSQQRSGMRAVRSFQPPCTVLTRYSYASGPNRDKEACAVIYFVPCEPGTSAIFAKFFTRLRRRGGGGEEEEGGETPLADAWREGTSTDSSSPSPKDDELKKKKSPPQKPSPLSRLQSSLLSRLLDSSLAHVLGQSLADQDVLVMHGIYKRMMMRAAAATPASSASGKARSPSSSSPTSSRWKSSYWLATQADVGVRAFHDWVERHGGGGPWGEDLGASSVAASSSLRPLPKGVPPTAPAVLDRWERHTRHCSVCLAALARLERARAVVAVAAGAAAAAAAAAGVVAAALAVSSSSGSSSASASPLASSPLTVAALARVGLPCAAAAVVLMLTWTWLTAWRGRFFRVDRLADEK